MKSSLCGIEHLKFYSARSNIQHQSISGQLAVSLQKWLREELSSWAIMRSIRSSKYSLLWVHLTTNCGLKHSSYPISSLLFQNGRGFRYVITQVTWTSWLLTYLKVWSHLSLIIEYHVGWHCSILTLKSSTRQIHNEMAIKLISHLKSKLLFCKYKSFSS